MPAAALAQPRIAAGLSPRALAKAFARHGRLHVPGFFRPADADRIAAALAGPVPWTRSVNVHGKSYDIAPEALAEMPADRRRQLEDAVAHGGRAGFQYDFDAWRISDVLDGGAPAPTGLEALAELYAFLNSSAFLDLVGTLAGVTDAHFADAQATRYRAGHFLTAHDDDVDGKNRRLAYVLSFTRGWRPDYGGLLLFHDADSHVAEGYSPTFNALNVFRVPQAHAVSQVASFVTTDRLSVTGWVRHR